MSPTLPASIPAQDGIYGGIPEAAYHADLTSLSSTGAKKLTTCTPAEFRYEQMNGGRSPKPEFDFGSLVHRLALGAGADIVTVDADDWRTKAAREQRAEAWERGAIPVLDKHWRKAERMLEALRLHDVATALLSGGEAEVSLYATDPITGVRLRGRVDYLTPRTAVDFKTTADASPRGFAKSIANFGYHQQAPWYLDLLAAAGRPVDDFIFVVQCVEPPFLPAVYRLAARAIDRGRGLNRRAIDVYASCLMSGEWPAYGNTIHTLDLPAWSYTDLLEPQP